MPSSTSSIFAVDVSLDIFDDSEIGVILPIFDDSEILPKERKSRCVRSNKEL
jgi:hypothetical protein